jgi:AcrR family transcriptional regulator
MAKTAPLRENEALGDGDEMRDRILAIAASVFSAQGYQGTNLDDVASRLGIKRQALYYYFPRKVDILIELNERMLSAFDENVALAAAAAKPDDDLFQALLRAHIKCVAENTTLVAIFGREAWYLPDPDGPNLMKLRRDYQARFAVAYAEGVRKGRLRPFDPKVAVQFILGAANAMPQWYSSSGRLSTDAVADLATDLLARGFVAEH